MFHWSFFLFFFFALSSLGHSFSAAAKIFGEDDRFEVDRDSFPFNQVVRIDGEEGSWSCTGLIVGEKLVLTNAHCLGPKYKNGELKNLPRIDIYRGWRKGHYEQKNKAVQAVWPLAVLKRSDDWAVLTVEEKWTSEKKPENHLYLKSDIKKYFSKNMMLAGYSSDYRDGEVLSLDQQCSIRNVDRTYGLIGSPTGVLFHDCATASGSSGAPLFHCYTKNNGNETHCYLMGLNSAESGGGGEYSYILDVNANLAVHPQQFQQYLPNEFSL